MLGSLTTLNLLHSCNPYIVANITKRSSFLTTLLLIRKFQIYRFATLLRVARSQNSGCATLLQATVLDFSICIFVACIAGQEFFDSATLLRTTRCDHSKFRNISSLQHCCHLWSCNASLDNVATHPLHLCIPRRGSERCKDSGALSKARIQNPSKTKASPILLDL